MGDRDPNIALDTYSAMIEAFNPCLENFRVDTVSKWIFKEITAEFFPFDK